MSADHLPKKYTFIGPAFSYMDAYAAAKALDPNICSKIARLQVRTCQLIDENIDRPLNEKNALIVGAVFSFIPASYLAHEKPEGFDSRTARIVQDIIAFKAGTDTQEALDVAHVMLAAATALMEDVLDDLKKGKLNAEQRLEATFLSAAPRQYPRDKVGISAERLLQVYCQTGEALAKELQKKNPPAPKPPGY